jgi:hypothetical protein
MLVDNREQTSFYLQQLWSFKAEECPLFEKRVVVSKLVVYVIQKRD